MGSKFLFAAAALLASAPAAAAVTVLGNSSARLCYEAAESRSNPSMSVIRTCDQAMRDEALSDYDYVATLVNRGILKVRLGQVDEAISDYDAALDRDPDEAEAYLNKGFALLHLPDAAQQARPMFDSALAKRTRKPALAYYGRAVANELSGHVRAAYEDYRQASQLDPNWKDPKADLARFAIK
ncbi:MAG TPA: tetratricopeptide repeat protein [Allosphingosinicella sp.]|nr:tetratricopeptide repeat protein [Allosphingosinicella sp.]